MINVGGLTSCRGVLLHGKCQEGLTPCQGVLLHGKCQGIDFINMINVRGVTVW